MKNLNLYDKQCHQCYVLCGKHTNQWQLLPEYRDVGYVEAYEDLRAQLCDELEPLRKTRDAVPE